jgi:hypothetical protein
MRLASRTTLAAVALSIALGGCGASRNDLGTSATACYRALPTALDAVHRHGRLVGVRRRGRTECAIALRGSYAPGDVETATIEGSHYAVVTVNIEHKPNVVGILITDKLPMRFHHG